MTSSATDGSTNKILDKNTIDKNENYTYLKKTCLYDFYKSAVYHAI